MCNKFFVFQGNIGYDNGPQCYVFTYIACHVSGPGSVVGIATNYELGGPRIES